MLLLLSIIIIIQLFNHTYMKYILIFFFFISSQFTFSQEECYVISVKGTILKKSSGQVVKPNDQLKPTDQLVFKTKDAAALCESRTKGSFVIKPKQEHQTGIFTVVEGVVNDYLKLSSGRLSTRAVFSCDHEDFISFLSRDSYLLIGDTAYIKNCEKLYPQSGTSYFLLQYQVAGDFQQAKLGNEMNKIKFISSSIFMVDGVQVNAEDVTGYELWYSKEGQSPSKVCSFHPHFVSGSELKATLVSYLAHTGYSKLPEKQQIDSIKVVIANYYGTPDHDELITWLKKNFNLTYPEK